MTSGRRRFPTGRGLGASRGAGPAGSSSGGVPRQVRGGVPRDQCVAGGEVAERTPRGRPVSERHRPGGYSRPPSRLGPVGDSTRTFRPHPQSLRGVPLRVTAVNVRPAVGRSGRRARPERSGRDGSPRVLPAKEWVSIGVLSHQRREIGTANQLTTERHACQLPVYQAGWSSPGTAATARITLLPASGKVVSSEGGESRRRAPVRRGRPGSGPHTVSALPPGSHGSGSRRH
jgi:hypothetical protein